MTNPRALISGLCFLMLVWSIHSFWQNSSRSPALPEVLFGIPVYPGSELNLPLSGTGEPRIFVFLSDDPLDKVLAFYSSRLKASPNVLRYGKGSMTVYQYMIRPSQLANYPLKGVEVMPYNSFYKRVMRKGVKIKIYIPGEEIGDTPTLLDQPAQPAGT